MNDKNKEVGVVLPVDYLEEVDDYADRNGLSRSAVLRMRLLQARRDVDTLPLRA